MTRPKEIAKFFCGFEAFHTILHGALWGSGTTLTVLGITIPAGWNLSGLVINAAISLGLGLWAWRSQRRPE